jgi:hypothetical protein
VEEPEIPWMPPMSTLQNNSSLTSLANFWLISVPLTVVEETPPLHPPDIISLPPGLAPFSSHACMAHLPC